MLYFLDPDINHLEIMAISHDQFIKFALEITHFNTYTGGNTKIISFALLSWNAGYYFYLALSYDIICYLIYMSWGYSMSVCLSLGLSH